MSKILLVDTNRAAYTIYQSLLAKGHEVFVVGGNPDEPLAKICPNFFQLDYSDASALDRLIEREGFDFIVPGCTDVTYKSCAEVNRGRFVGIDSVEAERAINDKIEFRGVAARLGIPVPKLQDFRSGKKYTHEMVAGVEIAQEGIRTMEAISSSSRANQWTPLS